MSQQTWSWSYAGNGSEDGDRDGAGAMHLVPSSLSQPPLLVTSG